MSFREAEWNVTHSAIKLCRTLKNNERDIGTARCELQQWLLAPRGANYYSGCWHREVWTTSVVFRCLQEIIIVIPCLFCCWMKMHLSLLPFPFVYLFCIIDVFAVHLIQLQTEHQITILTQITLFVEVAIQVLLWRMLLLLFCDFKSLSGPGLL
jgi:hypothetical protein